MSDDSQCVVTALSALDFGGSSSWDGMLGVTIETYSRDEDEAGQVGIEA